MTLTWISVIPLQHVQPSATCLLPGGPGQDESGAACSGLVRPFPDGGCSHTCRAKGAAAVFLPQGRNGQSLLLEVVGMSSLMSRLAFAKELKQTEGELLPFK